MSYQDIYVTQPFLPALGEFIPYLEEIWSSGFVTNNGKMHQTLEAELARHLGVAQVTLFNNGTTALLAALYALGVKGEVITTPFSFVATSHAISWQGLTPVFVDIDPVTLNMDPSRIEAAITPRTAAIMPVHCYGHPCDTAAIQEIAARHGLPVIYDAAHAFGVTDQEGSILRHGTMSVLSFHATKTFNTFEGGAVISHDPAIRRRLDQIKNFGFASETEVTSLGINGKMSEINAAFGLLQLKHLPHILAQRRKVHRAYCDQLSGMKGLRIKDIPAGITHNYSYFPVLVEPEFSMNRDELHAHIKKHQINVRRYFYPLISNFQGYAALSSASPANLPAANRAADRVLCLPIHANLSKTDVQRVVDAVASAAR